MLSSVFDLAKSGPVGEVPDGMGVPLPFSLVASRMMVKALSS